MAVYNAMDGRFWDVGKNENWLTDAPLDQWSGVKTNEESRVIRLEISRAGSTGQIPPELGNLANLQSLGLGGNQLRGEIPPELGNLANLQELYLGSNQLTGEIPPELGNLANLTVLGLGGNQLTGQIPPELGNFANLTRLLLDNNQLTG